jgi:hypothetical protein
MGRGMSDLGALAFQNFPLAARPIHTAVLQRRNEAMAPFKAMPEHLKFIGSGWEFHSISASLTGLDVHFEEGFLGGSSTVHWDPALEDHNGRWVPFDYHQWPSEIEVTSDEADQYNRKLSTIWRSIEGAFLDSALAGREAIYARIGSPVERSVTRIPADVWANFEVVNWKTGKAVVRETKDVLYGTCSVALSGSDPSIPSSNEQALALLIRENENRVASELPPLTIPETEAWARSEGLSREVARALREKLPESLKLKPGQKKGDASP